jgi:hypothetical protein
MATQDRVSLRREFLVMSYLLVQFGLFENVSGGRHIVRKQSLPDDDIPSGISLPEVFERFRGLIFLLLNSNFPHTKFDSLQRLSAFFNSFLISSTAFQFSSTAFQFSRNTRKSIYGSKYTKDHYLSFVFPATCSPSFVIPAN